MTPVSREQIEQWEREQREYIYSERDICEYLGIRKSVLYKWIRKYKLPAKPLYHYRKKGPPWKFNIKEVDRWINADGVTLIALIRRKRDRRGMTWRILAFGLRTLQNVLSEDRKE